MREITGLIILGWLGILLAQLPFLRRWPREFVLLPLSLCFLVYCLNSWANLLLMVTWVTAVAAFAHVLRRYASPRAAKMWVAAYVAVVVSIFILYKLNVFTTGETNLLAERAMPLGFSFVMFLSIAFLLKVNEPLPLKKYFSGILFFPTFAVGPFVTLDTLAGEAPEAQTHRTFQGYAYFCLGVLKFALSGVLLNPHMLRAMPLSLETSRKGLHTANILFLGSVFLYTNFSGYSDMVVGLSRMMGVHVPLNFRFPFLSVSLADYWRRWHVSLGAWFKEFFYFPLSYRMSRRWSPELSSALAAFLTFLVIGLWHQISWKFLLYASLNSALVVFFMPNNRSRWLGVPITFAITLLINGLFLAKDLPAYGRLLQSVWVWPEAAAWPLNLHLLLFGLVILIFLFLAETMVELLSSERARVRYWALYGNFALCLVTLFVGITLGIGRVDSVYIGY